MTELPGGALAQRFEIRRQLGKGGFATVYEALDRRDGRLVALKVLEPDRNGAYDPQTRARFHREIEILASLRSPYTVRVLDRGEADGQLFAVFEYLGGEDLSQSLRRRGVFSPEEAVHIVRQCLLALAEAHRNGLVHRDLKPENVRVFEADGDPLRVKLLDFGIARPLVRAARVTETGELIGTPRYMSPEQLKAEDLTPASDIYSLGLIAFELLLGRDALPGNKWSDQFDRLRTGHLFSAPQLEHLGPLLTIIQRMTAHDPRRRYADAQAVLDALDGPTQADAAEADVVGDARGRARPFPWLGAAFVGSILLAAAALLWKNSRSSEPTGRNLPAERNLAALLEANTSSTVTEQPDESADAGRKDITAAVPHAGSNTYPVREDASPSSGCHTPDVGFAETTAVHEAIHADESPDQPLPLVILLHSDFNTAAHTIEVSGLAPVADREGFHIVAPDSAAIPGLDTAWRGKHDGQRIEMARENAARSLCIDENRVFIVASGDGGRKVHQFYDKPWVRAVAFNSYLENSTFASQGTAVSAMWVLPKNSIRLPLDGSPTCRGSGVRKWGLQRLRRDWMERNGCRGEPQPDDDLGKCATWTECRYPLTICQVPGGVGFPGENRSLAVGLKSCDEPENHRLPFAEKIWDFLITAPPRTR